MIKLKYYRYEVFVPLLVSWLSTVLSLLDHSMLTNDELESVWPGVGIAGPLRLHCQPGTIPSPQSDWLTLERRSFGDYN